ncbi:ParA family protein [Pedobacter sp. MC2016-24]|uniref:ParA family protein n=1 Tax=Pedobacter sp. MC2016-24 TaxID=2780090 RepID=UPI00187E5D72|nr:ParA family protein [Pedobacter sp. MC2016-24]MBE9599889.1 ParA family protein [Pedobacter sp. MC2016-24]
MIILIGNQKGGPGKSTIALLLANFLTQVKKHQVTLIDMDYQQSIAQMYSRAKILDSPPPYEVVAANLEQFEQIKPILSRNPDMIFLIDLPGKLDDDGLIPLFQNADLVLCPFAYSELSFDSTILFSVVLKKIKPDISLVFIPNRIKATVNYRTKSDVEHQLSQFGNITPAIPDRIDFQRITTVSTPINVQPLVIAVFSQIYADYIKR